MTEHSNRLERLEQRRRPARRRAVTFVPVGIAGTEEEAAWLAAERAQRGLTEQDELIAFRWREVQEP